MRLTPYAPDPPEAIMEGRRMPCSNCPRRNECVSICPELERELPSMDAGRFNHGYWRSRDLERVLRRRVLVHLLLDWRHFLTGRQRQVIDLFLNEGLTQRQIAERLGIAQKNVCVYLQRAYRKIWKLMSAS